MKILITGITGFVGSAAANHFALLGHDILGIGRSKRLLAHVSNLCTYKQADIRQPIPDIECDIVIHAAGLASDTAAFDDLYAVNAEGTKNVLEATKTAAQFIHVSSSSVYHFTDHAMKETEAGIHYELLSNYGKTKFLAEQFILDDKTKKHKTILRPRAIYGTHDLSLLPRLIKLVKGNKLFLPAHLSKGISLTSIQNLLQVIEYCLDDDFISCEILNIADDEAYDLHSVLTTLLPLVFDRKLHTVTIPAWIFELFVTINSSLKLHRSFNRFAADSLTKTTLIDISKIKALFNYQPKKNFYNSYPEIGHWIHQEEGWKYFFNTTPKMAAL